MNVEDEYSDFWDDPEWVANGNVPCRHCGSERHNGFAHPFLEDKQFWWTKYIVPLGVLDILAGISFLLLYFLAGWK